MFCFQSCYVDIQRWSDFCTKIEFATVTALIFSCFLMCLRWYNKQTIVCCLGILKTAWIYARNILPLPRITRRMSGNQLSPNSTCCVTLNSYSLTSRHATIRQVRLSCESWRGVLCVLRCACSSMADDEEAVVYWNELRQSSLYTHYTTN